MTSTTVVRVLVAAVALVSTLAGAPAAQAVPPAPPNPSDQQIGAAQTAEQMRAAEVGRIAGLVAQTEGQMARLALEAEAAADRYYQAEGELQRATLAAEQTRLAAQSAAAGVEQAQLQLEQFARNSYIQGSSLDSDLFLLDSNGPADLIERAGLLESVSSSRLDVLSQVELARVAKANADSAARQAVIDKRAAEGTAAALLAQAKDAEATAEETLSALAQQKAQYDAELQAAQETLLGLEGARSAYQQWEQQKTAEEAAAAAAAAELARQAAERSKAQQAAAQQATTHQATTHQATTTPAPASPGHVHDAAPPQAAVAPVQSGAWALPLGGTLTSCYCERWGTMHWGIDIAAPMYTPPSTPPATAPSFGPVRPPDSVRRSTSNTPTVT